MSPLVPPREPVPAATLPSGRAETTAATFCATLVDEWIRGGLTDAVICPGSRSTPMALALAADDRIRVDVHHDERSACFLALGVARATGRPSLVLTTSGTAAANLHPGVVEAHHSRTPLVLVTADRPPERRDQGAAQTIDQTHLFARSVRWYHDPGPPAAAASGSWRALAARVLVEAVANPAGPGPVHLNLPFREPLVGTPGPLPAARLGGQPWVRASVPRADVDDRDVPWDLLSADRRGVVVAGPWTAAADACGPVVAAVASRLGWPLLTDARLRGDLPVEQQDPFAPDRPEAGGATVVASADALLRSGALAGRMRPEVVLHLGGAPASRVVDTWIAGSEAAEVRVAPHGWTDPGGRAAWNIACDPARLGDWLAPRGEGANEWAAHWAAAEVAAQAAIDEVLAGHDEPTEPGVARSLLGGLAPGCALVVSSSMPVRDLEWYGRPRSGVDVHANRGANGIDGVVSTAVGVALGSGRPTALLIGDVALLHDTNGLLGAARREIDLTVVVVDNDGGGIFSFLPQRASVPPDRFERLFGTPHGVDVGRLAAVHGATVTTPRTMTDVEVAAASVGVVPGLHVVHVRTGRDANVAVHDEIHAAVAGAVRDLA
ncbi:MAG: 2-succinyl-5-enolpyruvyl-6-hydroxy-3-cyclohexene-1-carboxylic-acid synthase [Actinobacteria bacterium]|nr:2-succinyl-5-enolpyruvyl-6-hydroxy-3-cyclohexene-1-carboxylic-acid synthase [Actinomycetota bacterium]